MLPPLSQFSDVEPQDYNRLVAVVNQITGMSAAAPLELNRGGGGFQFRLANKGFQAMITNRLDRSGSGNQNVYSVKEVTPDTSAGPGQWMLLDGGRELTDIVFENNDKGIDAGAVVFVEPVDNNDWRFSYCCGEAASSSSSSSSSSSGSFSASGSTSGSGSSSSSSSGGGSCVTVVTAVSCSPGGGLVVTTGQLCGSVTIGGVTYPINLTVS